jgi:coenzyme F420-dependent glucose-6-phosphate dehydrogenase
MPREEILGRYTVVRSPDEITAAYGPLVEDLGADIVTLQMASNDQPDLIRLLGSDVLPRLRDL